MQDDLLINGGFEEGEVGWRGWVEETTRWCRVQGDVVRSGMRAAHFGGIYEFDGGNHQAGVLQDVRKENFPGPGKYRIEAYVRGNDKGIIVMDFGCPAGVPDYPGRADIPIVNGVLWRLHTWDFEFPPELFNQWMDDPSAYRMWFDIRIDPNQNVPPGTEILVYVDDFKVYRYEEGPPPPCFIATAAYGTSLAPQLKVLRRFRDRCIPNRVTNTYYKVSPPIANFIAEHDRLRWLLRETISRIIRIRY